MKPFSVVSGEPQRKGLSGMGQNFQRGLASPEVNVVERMGIRGSSLPGKDETKQAKISIICQLPHLVFQ